MIYPLNVRPSFASSPRNFVRLLFPIPCNDKIFSSLKLLRSFNDLIFSLSSARRAGAASKARKLPVGLRSDSQIGQVGQSELL